MPTTLGPHTVKDWLATSEGERWELIHGNLVMTEDIFGNSSLAGEIEWKIRNYLEAVPVGIVRQNVAFHFPGLMDADREGWCPTSATSRGASLPRSTAEPMSKKG